MTMNTQAKIGNALLRSLIALRQQKGEVRIEDVGAMLQEMAATLQADESSPVAVLRREIEMLASYITQAKAEISTIVPSGKASEDIGHATTQLSAVVKATEEATHNILDAVDGLQHLIADSVKDKAVAEKMSASCAKIYEACNFQDLTGQRIKKVMAMLEHIEEKVASLVALFSAGGSASTGTLAGTMTKKDKRKDAHLLNGPQLPDEAPDQKEVDALFASLH